MYNSCFLEVSVFILFSFFYYLDFLSRTFTIYRTVRKGEGCFVKSSLPLPPASQTLNWPITAKSLHTSAHG